MWAYHAYAVHIVEKTVVMKQLFFSLSSTECFDTAGKSALSILRFDLLKKCVKKTKYFSLSCITPRPAL